MPITTLPRLPNQGQAFAAGWNNQAQLKDFTALFGTDNLRFTPVYDRDYSTGVTRRLSTGGTRESGMPIIRVTIPYISYGQLDWLLNTAGAGNESFNATYRGHKPTALTASDTTDWNVVANLELSQLPSLTKRPGGYENYVLELVIVEVL